MAWAMFAFATWITALAASSVASPSGSPTPSRMTPLGDVAVERHGAAHELHAEAAEHEVRVRVGRLVAAAAVAGRPGVGAGRLRPVAQRAGLVDPGQRAATGADRQDLDAGEADRVAVLDRPLVRRAHLAAV